ncbi:hypothetical protein [Pseudomonas monteilii]|uniref:Uncharacterized protein n=1 Tax=Pseudomonas monteilii TaxID=76759 RepID=A0AAP7FJ65_9PSED|nr:hypothetical protein [Pseudomonas monteilii]MCE0981696.1 hypothetical protein [Pseudomonas monteilii]OAH45506.1 hypothetical protein AYJ70_20995 [Pseudomonas monteilii]
MTFLAILVSAVVIFIAYAAYEYYSSMAVVMGGKKTKARAAVVFAAVVLAAIWVWLYAWSNSPQREVEAQAKDCGNTTLAFVMTQNFVKQRLKSPESAKFPYVNERGVNVFADGNCGFSVSAYVDSQNGFGAMIRSNYQAAISYDRQTKLWRLGDLTIQ